MNNTQSESLINRIYTRQVRTVLVLIQLVFLYLPQLMLFSVPTDNGPIPASLCYFAALLFAPYLLANLRRLKWPRWYLLGFFLFVFVWAAVQMPRYGLSKSILHWAFAFYLFVMLPNVGHDFSKERWLGLLEAGACIFAVLHVINTICHPQIFLDLLEGYFNGSGNGYYASLIPSLTRGGRNLDATWLALGAFFVRGRKKALYATYVLLFPFVASSRVGIIAIGFVMLWSLFYDPMYRLTLRNLKWYLLYAVVILAILISSGTAQGLLSRIGIHLPTPAQLFGMVTQEQAQMMAAGLPSTGFLSGRESMWSLAPEAFMNNPFGYGVGNAMRVLRAEYGFSSYEDVMHNVFMQLALDEGIIGIAWFVAVAVLFAVSQWKLRPRFLEKPIAAYFFTYLVLSLVQFHGGEALMHFTMAIGMACPVLLYAKEGKDVCETTMPEGERSKE